MGEDELENYEADLELQLYREYRDVLPMFTYVVETERRFYLANEMNVRREQGWWDVTLRDAWVWDVHRPSRFVASVHVVTTHDVNVEELGPDLSAIEGRMDQPPPPAAV